MGGVALLWIAYKLVQPEGGEGEAGHHSRSLRSATWLILVAAVTMAWTTCSRSQAPRAGTWCW